MKILISLTYFSPNKSGLTVYAERLAGSLVTLGHEVTVITSKHISGLPEEAVADGVRVIRLPVAFKLSKGVILPSLVWRAWSLIRSADVVNLHLPQFEGAYLALLAKIMRKPLVVTHHSDLVMPKGIVNKLAGWAARIANRISEGLANVVVHNTQDFAENSPILSKFMDKLEVIPTPIVVEDVTPGEITAFREKWGIEEEQIIIGMAARLATEKGVEYLVEAMQEILKLHPTGRVLFAGEYQQVIGEDAYRQRVMHLVEQLGVHWTWLGVDSQKERAAFYHTCRVLVLPSINRTETFGMVQVEALKCGTPLVASDLPGVRQPVRQSGFGEIVALKDSHKLAEAILTVLEKYPEKVDASAYVSKFEPREVARQYETLYKRLI